MVTALKPEDKANTAVAENAVAPAATTAPAAAVDVSRIPETPAELLKEWDSSRKPLLHTVIAATFVRLWNVMVGPGMTERARLEREIAETRGYRDGFTKLV